jgi:hypothetical protein
MGRNKLATGGARAERWDGTKGQWRVPAPLQLPTDGPRTNTERGPGRKEWRQCQPYSHQPTEHGRRNGLGNKHGYVDKCFTAA